MVCKEPKRNNCLGCEAECDVKSGEPRFEGRVPKEVEYKKEGEIIKEKPDTDKLLGLETPPNIEESETPNVSEVSDERTNS